MSEKTQEEIEYEERLRYRLNLLKEQFEAGKIQIAQGLDVADSIRKVKYGSDGEIDLDTVDGLVRSLALAAEGFHNRNETRKIASLSEIQNAYFKTLDVNFSQYYKLMKERNLTPHDCGRAAINSQGSINEVKRYMYDFLDFIEEFWESFGETAQIHVEDMHGIHKGVFGGDLFPSHDENLASKCGIYTDTIILPDPFLRSKHIFETGDDSQTVYYFIKHAMNLLQYKDLACTDIETPIVIVLPDRSSLDDTESEFNRQLGEEDSIKHYEKLFGRSFDSFEEFMEFASHLDSIEKTLTEINDPSRVLFDMQWKLDPKIQLEKMMQSKMIQNLGIKHPGDIITNMSFGRMATTNELLIKARSLSGTPILDAPTSWQYFKWKLEYDSEQVESITHIEDLHINKALQDLSSGEMQWIGNIPTQSLIEMRKEGAMDEIRQILSTDIHKLIEINPENFHRTHDQVFDNLQEAFNQHQKNLKELTNKKWKFAGRDIGSWLVTGGIEITAALTGSPLFGLVTYATGQVVDTPRFKDLPESVKALKEENDKIKKSPVGMLFNIQKQSVQ